MATASPQVKETYLTLEEMIKQETKHQIAKEMLRKGLDDDLILDITKLSKEELEKIKKDFEAENK